MKHCYSKTKKNRPGRILFVFLIIFMFLFTACEDSKEDEVDCAVSPNDPVCSPGDDGTGTDGTDGTDTTALGVNEDVTVELGVQFDGQLTHQSSYTFTTTDAGAYEFELNGFSGSMYLEGEATSDAYDHLLLTICDDACNNGATGLDANATYKLTLYTNQAAEPYDDQSYTLTIRHVSSSGSLHDPVVLTEDVTTDAALFGISGTTGLALGYYKLTASKTGPQFLDLQNPTGGIFKLYYISELDADGGIVDLNAADDAIEYKRMSTVCDANNPVEPTCSFDASADISYLINIHNQGSSGTFDLLTKASRSKGTSEARVNLGVVGLSVDATDDSKLEKFKGISSHYRFTTSNFGTNNYYYFRFNDATSDMTYSRVILYLASDTAASPTAITPVFYFSVTDTTPDAYEILYLLEADTEYNVDISSATNYYYPDQYYFDGFSLKNSLVEGSKTAPITLGLDATHDGGARSESGTPSDPPHSYYKVITAAGATTMDITFTNMAAGDGIFLRLYDDDAFSNQIKSCNGNDDVTCNFTGLTGATAYYISISNNSGELRREVPYSITIASP